jgi:hypothetical protein
MVAGRNHCDYTVTMAKTEPLTVRFSPREYALLSRAAQAEDRSRGSVVRRLVDQLDMPPDDFADNWVEDDDVTGKRRPV